MVCQGSPNHEHCPSPHLEALIREKVETGRYASAGEVVGEAIQLLEERDRQNAALREALLRDLQVGIDQADRGDARPLDVDALKRRIEQRISQGK